MNEVGPKKPKIKAKERREAARKKANEKFRHETNCAGKVGYESRADANREKIKMQTRRGRNFDVYLCTECGKYHFGGGKK
jgi:hypothetical protein